jgi:phosphate transport system permease protein
MVYRSRKEVREGSSSTKNTITLGNLETSKIVFLICAIILIVEIIFIIGFIFYTAIPIFQKEGIQFILGTTWSYDAQVYEILPFIAGTLCVTLVTIVIACPLSLMTAMFLSEYSPAWVSSVLRPMVELLVGIPSVVYGIFGLYVLGDLFANDINPFISSTLGFIPIFRNLNPNMGNGILLASAVLSIMILPTITSLSIEAIRAVPNDYKEASIAIGATKWETTKKIVIPIAAPGILTAIVLGIMRAMGETMAIVMLTGNNMHVPGSLLDTVYAMTSKILMDLPNFYYDDQAKSALFGMAAVLVVFEIIAISAARVIGSKGIRSGEK